MKQELATKYAELLNERRPHEARTPQVDMDACDRINAQLKLLRVEMLWIGPSLEERIAIAFFLANDRKDATYDKEEQRYTITDEEAMAWAFKETGAPAALSYPFSLAMYWGNDLEVWADDTLSNGSVTEYCKNQKQEMDNARS